MKRLLNHKALPCLLLVLNMVGLSACEGLTSSNTPVPEPITVAAASDLQFAFQEIAEIYEQETGQPVRLVFGSSGQLAQQIENGAPYDLFAAANTAFVERLAEQELIVDDSITIYTRGRIVLAANRKAGVEAVEMEDLLDPSIRHIAIANPYHAPYGLAAQEALQSAGIWDQVQGKLVRGETVRQALQYVQSGDAEVGIIALSLADVPEITWTLIDEELYKPMNQAMGLLVTSKSPFQARQFAEYIIGPTGRPVMRRYGFLTPGEPVVEAPGSQDVSE